MLSFYKFIHVILALSLLGMICSILMTPSISIVRINKFILMITIPVMLTGTLLVQANHLSFHTPWIQAAYILAAIFFVFALILFFCKEAFFSSKWITKIIYLSLFVLLMLIIHDAVTKSTFLI